MTRILAATALVWALLCVAAFAARFSRMPWHSSTLGRTIMTLTVCTFGIGTSSILLRLADTYAVDWVPAARCLFALTWIVMGGVFLSLSHQQAKERAVVVRRRGKGKS